MYDESEFGPKPKRPIQQIRKPGVSPGWRTAAILALIAASLFFLGCVALSMALVIEQEAPPPTPSGVPAWMGLAPDEVEQRRDNAEELRAAAMGIYPLQADLAQGAEEGGPAPAHRETVRERFLKQARKVFTLPDDTPCFWPRVSPDGRYVVWVNQNTLQHHVLPEPDEPPPDDALNRLARQPGHAAPQVQGAPTWLLSPAQLAWTNANGFLVQYDERVPLGERVTSFHGEAPAAVPGQPEKVLLLRSRPAPLLETPGRPLPGDPVEVVLADLTTNETRVVVPAGPFHWESVTASPDGKRLALISAPGLQEPRQIYLGDLNPDKPGQPKPLGPASPGIKSVCWSRDGRSLIHERIADPVPFDHVGERDGLLGNTADLVQLDVGSGKLTRLTRGGGFTLAGISSDEMLFFLDERTETETPLYRLPLASARAFAAREPEQPFPGIEAWQGLIDQALKAGGITAIGDEPELTPEQLARVAATFADGYAKRLKQEAPADAASWERLNRQLYSLTRSASERSTVLVLGAAEGEFLRHQHGAAWHLTKGPLIQRPAANALPAPQSPFAVVLNPFELASSVLAEDPASILAGMRLARGRTIVLANDPAEGERVVASLADPDLERASELLRQNQAAAGEKLLLELVKRPKHAHNDYLALEVARLLYEYGRVEAVRQLLVTLPEADRADRKYRFNLKGLVLLEANPQAAVGEFKDALRCDLLFGPAYLNLAQAYEKTGQREAAQLCLKRLLRLMPYGSYSASARQRLAEMDSPPGGP